MSQVSHPNNLHFNTAQHKTAAELEAEREAAHQRHDRELEEQAKQLQKELEDAKHTRELEDKVKHLKDEIDKVEHPPTPLPWPLNHLHGQADGHGETEVAMAIAHPDEADGAHIVEAVHDDHAIEAVADPSHHDATHDASVGHEDVA